MSLLRESLAATATLTFEDMCFFVVSPLLTDEQRDAPADAAVQVRFRGPLSGRLVVRLSTRTLPVLASNMLGDVDGSPTMQRDALGEVANVICGNLLPIIGGTDAIYTIDPAQPTVILRMIGPEPQAYVHLGLEETGRADLLLYIDSGGDPS
jgi:chemotaxis protein CheY-P-specific phosphatase CheC